MTATETHSFQAEVNEVLSIVVNSLYSHREVFLRELISNASDATDKLSFAALTQHDLDSGEERTIDVIPSQEAGTLTIRDSGIGMSRDELIGNLGTIARSGSKKLMESLSGDNKSDLSLIGQFGVGFYSAFLVADRVTVTSKQAGEDGPGHQWESEAKGEFSVAESEREQPGTNVILHLKEDAKEFLDEWRIKELVRKYSDYVRHPIRLQVERTRPVGDEKDEQGQPKETETVREWETINSASALWTRPRNEITDEQYEEFYKHLAHDWETPLAHTHFKIEGTHELTGLLFVPGRRPLDLFDRTPKGLRLFVKRVFIMEDCAELLPEYLRFVRGVIDSEDLPLNVSRELLQQDRTSAFIKKQVTSRVLTLLEELAAEGPIQRPAKSETTDDEKAGDEAETTEVNRFAELWGNFGSVLKEGVHLDHENRDRLAKLLRYESSGQEGVTSLTDYLGRMPDGQPGIYYLTAQSLDTARGSPHTEALRKHGYEVLFMTDPIDEWVADSLHEFEGKKLIAADKGALELPESDEDKKKREATQSAFADMLEKVKGLFSERVKDVRLTDRLTDSPACLVTDEHGLSPRLERILRASGQSVPEQKRILELNPEHPVIRSLEKMSQDEQQGAEFEEWTRLVYDQALVAEGSLPEDPSRLARSITDLLRRAVEK